MIEVKWKMIHRDAQTAFLRCAFPKRRNPRRTRNRDDLPCDLSSEKRILAAKTARKTDDFPKHLRSPYGTRAGDDGVPTHIMLRAALKHDCVSHSTTYNEVPTHIMPRAALKHLFLYLIPNQILVPTHIMLRAALKHPEVLHVVVEERVSQHI